jgi:hypothetical protein
LPPKAAALETQVARYPNRRGATIGRRSLAAAGQEGRRLQVGRLSQIVRSATIRLNIGGESGVQSRIVFCT